MDPLLGIQLSRLEAEVNAHIKRWGWPISKVQIGFEGSWLINKVLMVMELKVKVTCPNGDNHLFRYPNFWLRGKPFLPDPIWASIEREVFHA